MLYAVIVYCRVYLPRECLQRMRKNTGAFSLSRSSKSAPLGTVSATSACLRVPDFLPGAAATESGRILASVLGACHRRPSLLASRFSRPVVLRNCGAIPECFPGEIPTVDSAFFGHL